MPRKSSPKRSHLLRSLDLFGLEHLDPVILASLADGQPLLLIGRHGTAKSELLNRIAESLRLDHRHYNSSLIAFDDLLGYPVPNQERNGLCYLHTEGDLWGAESVFLDEISRCRPEHQNKLFSIIYEKRVQGLKLEKLRYRWAAMNPPVSLESLEEQSETYQGSLPLDPALADRFPYIVELPDFDKLGTGIRLKIIESGGLYSGDGSEIKRLITCTERFRKKLGASQLKWCFGYVNALVLLLKKAELPISGRRAVTLAQNISWIYSASQALGARDSLEDCAFTALKWGLPQRARGVSISVSKLNAVHKSALLTAGADKESVLLKIQAEADPVYRIALALEQPVKSIPRIDFSQLVTDAYAGLSVPERYLLSRNLLPALCSEDRITSATCELLAEPLVKLLRFTEKDTHQVRTYRSRSGQWNEILKAIRKLQKGARPESEQFSNILYTLFAVEQESFDPWHLIETDQLWGGWFDIQTKNKVAA